MKTNTCEECTQLTSGDCGKHAQCCNHDFEIGRITTAATAENYIYHKVGYAVCRKCGEIRKQDI